MGLIYPAVNRFPLARYAELLGRDRFERVLARVAELRARLAGRVVWNVSSSAVGGGVAEMVRSLAAYARGADVDARWAVISGQPALFRITKRLHHALHGAPGDGSPLGADEQRVFARLVRDDAGELLPMVRRHDIVVVHDPQPAAMVPELLQRGARVIWRCHIGADGRNAEVELGWRFLAPFVREANAYVFSRPAYVPPELEAERAVIIPPSLDPFSAKNQPLDDATVLAILQHTGIVAGAAAAPCCFVGEDGTPARVDRRAEVLRAGAAPTAETPLVVQVSRWDRLKDPVGVLRGFALTRTAAHLVLAGPDVRSVADDPEGALAYAEAVDAFRALQPEVRVRVHLVTLPTVDVDENAAIVNALQRHGTVVTQKSRHEGFGLTVTEALWKFRPVVASAVGGMVDQIDDGVNGLLIDDPDDGDAFAGALERLLANAALRQRLGAAGHERVLERYLGIDALLRYGALIERLDAAAAPSADAATMALQRSGSSGAAPTREA